MLLCPIAIAISCNKCPIVSVCPVKGRIGNYKPEPPPVQAAPAKIPVKTRGKRARTRRSHKR
jgi:hypothetical protein